jgi:hypothetical protein
MRRSNCSRSRLILQIKKYWPTGRQDDQKEENERCRGQADSQVVSIFCVAEV